MQTKTSDIFNAVKSFVVEVSLLGPVLQDLILLMKKDKDKEFVTVPNIAITVLRALYIRIC